LRRTPLGFELAASDADAVLDIEGEFRIRWGPGARRFVLNRRRVSRHYDVVLAKVREIVREGAGPAGSRLFDVAGLDGLDSHQLVNVAAMTVEGGFGLCVFDEQGTGKTPTAIYAFDVLVEENRADFALVVAPKSMVPEWAEAFGLFKGDLYGVAVMAGDRRLKGRALARRADVLVANYETVVLMEEELAAKLRPYGDRAVMIVDESFFAKNPDAARTRALRRLREECGWAFVLCGTPAPNSPHDLVEQFNLVDFGRTFEGVAIPADRDLALPVVRRALEERGIYVRNLKQDVLPDLPPRRMTRILLPFEPQQFRAYQAALDHLVLELEAANEATFRRNLASFLARRSALLQICSSPASVIPGYSEVPAKLKALDELLDDLIGRQGEKVVLWSFYTASVEAAVTRYARYRPVRYDGAVCSVENRHEAIRRFQEDDETMLFVGNPAAAGAGLTLHRARVAVYESISNQAAHFLQSLDRIHRRGQARDVEIIFLLCEGSIEVQEYDTIAAKESASRDLLGDSIVPSPTRELLWNEALRLRAALRAAAADGAPSPPSVALASTAGRSVGKR
jgi:SNF2 family DNA or RNA helicase